MDQEAAVLEFHQKHGAMVATEPKAPQGWIPPEVIQAVMQASAVAIRAHETMGAEWKGEPNVKLLRARLLMEEVSELIEALHEEDLFLIADGTADVNYVSVGTAVSAGIPFNEVFREVHRSNMTKVGLDANRKGGKIDKEGYEPADIEGAIYRGVMNRRKRVRDERWDEALNTVLGNSEKKS